MKKIITRPHLFFFSLIPIFILIGFLSGNDSFDINIHDTYFVFEYKSIYFLFSVFFGLIGLNYFSLYWGNKSIKKGLTITHLVFQILSLILFFTHSFWMFTEENPIPNGQELILDYSILIIIISFFIFLIGTIIHLISFFYSLISKSKDQ